MNIGSLNTPFIYRGEELIYPNPVKDGLVLWYDFSGRTNTDGQRNIAEDLSGNGNHGTLQNFNYSAESGYDKNKLLFDGVDDYVSAKNPLAHQMPENQSWSVEFVVKKKRDVSADLSLLGGINYGLRYNWSDGWKAFRMLNYTNLSANIYHYSPYHVTDNSTHHIVFSYSSDEQEASIIIDKRKSSTLHSDDEVPTGMQSNIAVNLKGGEIYSTKIYNRPLTSEEIAHNYAIENERFGIE